MNVTLSDLICFLAKLCMTQTPNDKLNVAICGMLDIFFGFYRSTQHLLTPLAQNSYLSARQALLQAIT